MWNVNEEEETQTGQDTGFNRNIVECKWAASESASKSEKVLIETLWNVNNTEEYIVKLSEVVLIETLWNVNVTIQGICRDPATGFNRNIVECKFKGLNMILNTGAGFNRNIVECKSLFKLSAMILTTLVLIETLWNVNLHIGFLSATHSSGFNRNIVECKYVWLELTVFYRFSFNRNIVECKLVSVKNSSSVNSSF